jgi:SAM-dependent methyltransferase
MQTRDMNLGPDTEGWKARVYASYRESASGAPADACGLEALWALERRQYIQRYRRFLPADRSASIVDIGCGSGTFLTALKALGYTRVEGIDGSPSQVAAAAVRGLSCVTLGSAVDYLNARANRFTLITAFSVLEHQTRAELFDLLDAVHTALIPGGTLVALTPNAKGLFGAHVRFADITHELSFTPTSVQQICNVTRLECIAIEEHGPLVHGVASGVRWCVWQAIRGALAAARLAEGGDWRQRVFTQDLVFVARKPA